MKSLYKFIKSSIVIALSLMIIASPSAGLVRVANAQAAGGAKVSITFDDGFASTYDHALPVLSARGIEATAYITTSFIGQANYMAWSEVQELQNTHGWEIGNHTVTHAELPLLSAASIVSEINDAQNTLIGKGLNVTSFATPFGAYNNIVLSEAMKILNIHRGFHDRDDLNAYPYNRATMMVQSVQTGVTPAQVKAWVDQAIAQSKWLILVYHEVLPALDPNYEYSNTVAELTEVADYIDQTGVAVVTENHALNKPGANLVANPTFANGLTDWNTDQPSNILLNSATKGSYPSATQSVEFNGSTASSHLFAKSIVSDPLATYLLEFFVNTDEQTAGELGFYIDEYDVNGNWISGQWMGMVAVDTVRFFTRFYNPTSANVKSFIVQTYITPGSTGKVYVDNYQVYNLNGTNPTPAPTATAAPSSTPVVTPSPSATPVTTATPTATPTVVPTATPVATSTPVATATPTVVPTATPVASSTPVATPSPSATPVVTPSPTVVPTATPVVTVTPTPTIAPTATPVVTPTPTVVPTSTPVATSTPVVTPSPTTVPTSTPVATASPSPSPTSGPVPSLPPVTGNLVKNHSFEELLSGWAKFWTQDTTAWTLNSAGTGFDGTNSLTANLNSQKIHLFSEAIIVQNVQYKWKQYIKTTNFSGELGFYVDEYNQNGKWISGKWLGMITNNFNGSKQFNYKPTSTKVKTVKLQYYTTAKTKGNILLDFVSLAR